MTAELMEIREAVRNAKRILREARVSVEMARRFRKDEPERFILDQIELCLNYCKLIDTQLKAIETLANKDLAG